MLGNRRRRLQEVSFAIDAVAGLALLVLVFLFLLLFGRQWERFLQVATGYPFHVNTVDHLVGEAWIIVLIQLCMLLALRVTRYYEQALTADGWHISLASIRGTGAGLATATLLFYLLQLVEVNRSLLLLFGLAFVAYQVPKEVLLRRWWLDRPQGRLEALLVCGAAELAERFAELTRGANGLCLRSVHLDGDPTATVPQAARELLVDGAAGIGGLLTQGRYDVVLMGNSTRSDTAQAVLAAAEEQGVDVWYFSRFPIPRLAAVAADDFAGQPVLVFKTATRYESRFAVKRSLDVVLSLLLLVLLSPPLLAIAAAIKLTSRGPVLFVQERTGWRGRTFRMLKFRSMFANAESDLENLRTANSLNGPAFKAADDPRVTPLGRWLRKYSLDELPQLLNVLKGQMSLVGPRPLPVYETSRFPAFRDYRRLSVLPGMTGLWQVSGRADIIDFDEWVRLDLQYIDRWSLSLDAKILLMTLPAVLRGAGAH